MRWLLYSAVFFFSRLTEWERKKQTNYSDIMYYYVLLHDISRSSKAIQVFPVSLWPLLRLRLGKVHWTNISSSGTSFQILKVEEFGGQRSNLIPFIKFFQSLHYKSWTGCKHPLDWLAEAYNCKAVFLVGLLLLMH